MENKDVETYQKTDGTKVTITQDDYDKALEMTEEEVHDAAMSDPDAQPLTDEQMSKFKRVNPRT